MANTKYYLEQIKRENELHDLLIKAQSVECTYNGTEMSLAAALTAVFGDISARPITSDVSTMISTAISQSGHAHFEKVEAVPAVESAQENVMYLVKNAKTKHYDIYAKIKGEGETYTMELLDDTTVDLTGLIEKVENATAGNLPTLTAEGGLADSGKKPSDFVEKETGKRLMTDEEGSKLGGIATGATKVEVPETPNGTIKVNDQNKTVYSHPSDAESAKAAAFRKVGRDAEGHAIMGDDVSKEDITALGIPGQDTTYGKATSEADGLQSKEDKARADAAGMVWVGATAPDAMRNGDLFIRVVNTAPAE